MSRFWNFVNKVEEESADLYIQGEIVEEGWEREFLADWGVKATASNELEDMLKELNGKPLNIHCNSFGGSLFAGTAMIVCVQVLRHFQCLLAIKPILLPQVLIVFTCLWCKWLLVAIDLTLKNRQTK